MTMESAAEDKGKIVDRDFIFNEIVQWIRPLGCYFSPESLQLFVLSENPDDREYRLTGRFGFGFKIRKRNEIFSFEQYKEEETEESLKWIDEHNTLLKELSHAAGGMKHPFDYDIKTLMQNNVLELAKWQLNNTDAPQVVKVAVENYRKELLKSLKGLDI